MTAQELYAVYAKSLNDLLGESWEDLDETDQQAWEAVAEYVNEEIDEAVVDAIPPVEAGQRTDV